MVLVLEWCTVYNGLYDTPLARFYMVDISTAVVEIVSVPKRSALETSVRELAEDVPFRIGSLLGVERWTLENRPRGASYVIYTPSYTGVVMVSFSHRFVPRCPEI